MTTARRYCRCGIPLARDNAGTLCAACQQKSRRDRPPEVPPGFWHTDVMADALASGNLGQVIRAYRSHPFHAQPLSQTVVAGWLHVSQTSLSRIEQGKCRLTIDDINGFAGALGLTVALRWSPLHDPGEDVDPLSRRSLLGAGVGAALGLAATTAPAAAREIDPELVAHWMKLLHLLGRHDAMCGPHAVLDTARHELGLIAEHRQVAVGDVRSQLLRVEARWSAFASALSDDAGDWHRRDSWADRSLRLAREAGYQDMVAYVLMRQSQWASDAQRTTAFAEAAARTRGTSERMRGLCALKKARGHALAYDAASCQRNLSDAYALLAEHAQSDQATPWDDLGSRDGTAPYVMADEARCWLWLRPRKAIEMFDDVLRLWPQDRTRGRGIHQAHLALACAAADEFDRAATEGMKALDIAKATKSDVTARELGRLEHRLAACDLPVVAHFREAFAALS
jgi:transcriptional regulator with XRE-family HTH domain